MATLARLSRSRWRRRRPLVLLGLTLLTATAAAQAPTREAELRAIREEIAVLQTELERIDARAEDLATTLRRTDLELKLQESRVAEAAAAHQVAVAQAEASTARVDALTRRLDELRERLRGRLIALYRLGDHGYLRLLLAVEPESDPLAVIRQLRFLLRRDAATRQRYLAVRADLDAETAEREQRRLEASRWLASEGERRLELVAVRRRQAALLTRLDAARTDLRDRESLLIAKEQRLANLIAMLYTESAALTGGRPIQDFRGVLDWPAHGRVAVGFGPREDPRYGTTVPHNGIELTTAPGSEVRVVFGGKVLFAAPFEGYGFTAVVQHPERALSLYAGLVELEVAKDDVLSLGDRVGVAGAAVYFELRVESRPEDPLLWLR